ncbi:hypothetical protein JGI13_02209, partial [Candidatus Kryptonium thompsonii]
IAGIYVEDDGFRLKIVRDENGVMPRVDSILKILLGLNENEIRELKIERTGQFIWENGVIIDPIEDNVEENKIGVYYHEEGNLYQHAEKRNAYSSS